MKKSKIILFVGMLVFFATEIVLMFYAKECYSTGQRACINASGWNEVFGVVGLIPIFPFFIFIVIMIIRVDSKDSQ